MVGDLSDRSGSIIRSDRRAFLKTGFAATGMVGLAGCVGDGANDGGTTGDTDGGVDEVVIGSNHPLSGYLAFDGQRMDKAVRLAAKLKNDDGGIESLDGAEVKVVSGDNEAAQEQGGPVHEQLIDEGAHVLTGCYTSPTTTAAAQVAEQEQIPFAVTVAANDDAVTDDMQYSWRGQPTSTKHGIEYVRLMSDIIDKANLDVDTIGFFYVNNSYGQSVSQAIKDRSDELGLEVVADTAYELGASNVDTQATKLKDADPDIVCPTTYAVGTKTLMDAFESIGYSPDYWAAAAQITFMNDEMVRQIGQRANGALSLNYVASGADSRVQELQGMFKTEFASDFDREISMDGAHFMGFTMAELAIECVERAGSVDPDDINEEFANIEFEDHLMAMDPITFDDTQENANAGDAVAQVQNLQPKIVYPEEFAGSEIQDPFAFE